MKNNSYTMWTRENLVVMCIMNLMIPLMLHQTALGFWIAVFFNFLFTGILRLIIR